jgi:pimeloyl-ACP methyl ester carboxylesterase
MRQGLQGQCRYLQYDYVGVGGSSAKTSPFHFFDLAGELADLLDALSVERIHLFGISKGSAVGQAFLMRHRQRAKTFCGLGNPNPLVEDAEQVFSVFQQRLDALEDLRELWPQRINPGNYLSVFNAVYVPIMFGKPTADLTLVERLRAWYVRRMVYPALEGTYIQTMVDLFSFYVNDAVQEAPAYASGLPQVHDVPILLLNGTADTLTPVHMSRELAQTLPGAELVEFEDVTHMGPMLLKKQAQPVFEQYVAFLRDHIQ